jgi:hypothetical protein
MEYDESGYVSVLKSLKFESKMFNFDVTYFSPGLLFINM